MNNVEDFQPTIVQLLGPKLTFDSSIGSQAAAKMKEAGDIGLAELMCTLDLYESHGMLWANTVLMVG